MFEEVKMTISGIPRAGEHRAKDIVIEGLERIPGALYYLVVQATNGKTYEIGIPDDADSIPIDASMVPVSGIMKVMLEYKTAAGDVLAKSDTVNFVIKEALMPGDKALPTYEAVKSIADRVLEVPGEIEKIVGTIDDVRRAGEEAEAAANRAEQAANGFIPDGAVIPETLPGVRANLFDKSKCSAEKILSNGSISAAAGYICSDYIPVRQGSVYTFPAGNNRCIALYGVDKTFLRYIDGGTGDDVAPLIIPDDIPAAWLRVSYNIAGTGLTANNFMMCVGGKYYDEYVPFGSTYLDWLHTAEEAELMDARVGGNGKTYDTAGEAMRGQYGELKETLVNFPHKIPLWNEFVRSKNLINQNVYKKESFDRVRKEFVPNENAFTFEPIKVSIDDTLYFYQTQKGNDKRSSEKVNADFIMFDDDMNFIEKISTVNNYTAIQNGYVFVSREKQFHNLDTMDYMVSLGERNTYYPYFEEHFESDNVDIRLRGGNEDKDNRDIILSIIEDNKTVIIPIGNWKVRPTLIKKPHKICGGNECYSYVYGTDNTSSVISAYENQSYVIKININDERENNGYSITNIVLSCADSTPITAIKDVSDVLVLENSPYGNFDIIIQFFSGNGLCITGSYELTFNRVYFRNMKGVGTCLKFKQSNQYASNQIFINDIQAEGCYGKIIESEGNSKFGHCNINSILIEGTVWKSFTEVTELTYDEGEQYTEQPFFSFGSVIGLNIGNIGFNGPFHCYEYNGVKYHRNTVIHFKNAYGRKLVNIGNITIDSNRFGENNIIHNEYASETVSNSCHINSVFVAKDIIGGSLDIKDDTGNGNYHIGYIN